MKGSLYTMKELLTTAQKNGFAVGAFSPRYTPLITPILRAAQACASPALVQIAQVELGWYDLKLSDFASQFWAQVEAFAPSVPVGLHLDHTVDFDVIVEAIDLGFTSVMIDASALPLAENIATTRKVVEYAHQHGVSVEAELGRIASGDSIESPNDVELYTDPAEAAEFTRATGVDALAVSVGTVHGVYRVRQPKVDIERLKQIRAVTQTPLVLHGGSGTPLELVRAAIQMPGGGISKVNIATDLELALLAAIGRQEKMSDAELRVWPAESLEVGLRAAQGVVEDKITNFLLSRGHAADYK